MIYCLPSRVESKGVDESHWYINTGILTLFNGRIGLNNVGCRVSLTEVLIQSDKVLIRIHPFVSLHKRLVFTLRWKDTKSWHFLFRAFLSLCLLESFDSLKHVTTHFCERIKGWINLLISGVWILGYIFQDGKLYIHVTSEIVCIVVSLNPPWLVIVGKSQNVGSLSSLLVKKRHLNLLSRG